MQSANTPTSICMFSVVCICLWTLIIREGFDLNAQIYISAPDKKEQQG